MEFHNDMWRTSFIFITSASVLATSKPSIWSSLCQWRRQVGQTEDEDSGNWLKNQREDRNKSRQLCEVGLCPFPSELECEAPGGLHLPFDAPGVWYHQMSHQAHFITMVLLLSLLNPITHNPLYVTWNVEEKFKQILKLQEDKRPSPLLVMWILLGL